MMLLTRLRSAFRSVLANETEEESLARTVRKLAAGNSWWNFPAEEERHFIDLMESRLNDGKAFTATEIKRIDELSAALYANQIW